MNGTTYKRCYCRDRATGKPLGAQCPKLHRGNTWNPHHGVWQYQIELPKAADGRRRPLRRGPFADQTSAGDVLRRINEALAVCEAGDAAALVRAGDIIEAAINAEQPIPDTATVCRLLYSVEKLDKVPTLAELLTMFMTSRGGSQGNAKRKKIKEGTRRSYQGHIDNHITPNLGDLKADRLTAGLIETRMLDTIEERNTLIDQLRASPDAEKRLQVKGMRKVGIATQHRILATLRAGLNWGIRRGIIPPITPVKFVEIAPETAPKKLIWTDERVAEWKLTGKVPQDAIMVWTPEQTGIFLDHLLACGDRLYALYHTIAYRGLRRGEGCGLRRSEYDSRGKKVTIAWQVVQHGWAAHLERPKTDGSYDDVPLDDGCVLALDTHLVQQRQERLKAGDTWVETGLIFTTATGQMLHPADVTDHFYFRLEQAGLPPIGLHGLRHGAATINLAAGVDMKVVQDLLRHASASTTSNLYTHVLPDLAYNAAEKAAASVPRKRHLKVVA